MDIRKIDLEDLEFTKEELDTLVEIVVMYDKIKSDKTLNQMVMKRAEKRSAEINSIQDIVERRNKLAHKTVQTADEK